MESDRAQADLGEAANAELTANQAEKAKQPKKRFIGRKAVAQKAEQSHGPNGTIEDTGAIQGIEIYMY